MCAPGEACVRTLALGEPFYPTSTRPTSVALGDVDEDGALDAIATGDRLQVLIGGGDGSFGEARDLVAEFAGYAALGDLNRDGHLDVVASFDRISDPSRLGIFVGNGDGTFRSERSIEMNGDPGPIVLADFDGDDVLDLVVSNVTAPTLLVFRGRGDGTFGSGTPLALEGNAKVLVAADLDGDDRLDLVASHDLDVSVLLGEGDATFEDPVRYPGGDQISWLDAGDLDGDGRIDLVTSMLNREEIGVLYGIGDGTFSTLTRVAHGGILSRTVWAADMDGDGDLDLVTSDVEAITIVPGNGDRTFGEPTLHGTTDGSDPRFSRAGDLNGDGRLDVVALSSSAGALRTLVARGDGTYQGEVPISRETGASPIAVTLADVDEDGRLDAVVVNSGGGDGTVAVLRGGGDGSFGEAEPYVLGNFLRSAIVRDVNGDSRLDLVVASSGDHDLYTLFGRGDGTFGGSQFLDLDGQATFVRGGDFNADGRLDLATTIFGRAGAILLGRGDGTYDAPVTFPTRPSYFVPLVLDGDDRTDLIVGDLGNVRLVTSEGDGTFADRVVLGPDGPPMIIEAADVNGDGRLDVVSGSLSRGIHTYLANADGTFAPPTSLTDTCALRAMTVADMDGDGRADLVRKSTCELAVLLGIGDGTFGEPQAFFVRPTGTSSAIEMLAVGDLDGDGRMDVATVAPTWRELNVLMNRTTETCR